VDFNGAPPGSAQASNLTAWCPGAGLSRFYSEATNFHCELPDNINRFPTAACAALPQGATPPNGLSSLY